MRLLAFALRTNRSHLLLATVASLTAGFASAGLMGYIGSQFTSDELIGPLAIVVFVALIAFSIGAGLTARFILVRLVGRRTHRLQMELANRLVATELPNLERVGSARLFAVLTDDARAVSEAMMRIPDLVISSALILGCTVYLGWLSPLAVSTLVLVAIPIALLYRQFQRRVKVLLARFFALRDVRYQQYQALTEGTKELQTDRSLRRRFLRRNLAVKGDEFRQSHEAVIMAHEVANSWSQAAYFVFVFVLLLLIRGEVISNEILAAYALIALYMRGAMMQLTAVIPIWTQANVALARIDGLDLADPPADTDDLVAIEHSEDPDTDSADAADADNAEDLPPVDSETVILAEGLTFGYAGEQDGYDFVLGPLDFELRSGEVVFITGGNGSGKTTLMKVLCALYEPTDGRLSCNGEPIDGPEARDRYRRRLSALFADGFLFEELIGIDDGDPATTETANRFLADLDLTAKVRVEDGRFTTTRLSTGERKRLALLGAYLRDRPVYAFDEWAANQDPVFKRVFYRSLLPELRARGKLVIVISHDDVYFDAADRVLHLADGELVDSSLPASS